MCKKVERVQRRSFTSDDREFLLIKTNGVCGHCGKPLTGNTATVDHVVPIKNQGTNDERNLICLCKECNQTKGSRIIAPTSYYKYLNKESMIETLDYFNEFNYTAIFEHGDAFNKFTVVDEFSMFANEMSLDRYAFSGYMARMFGTSVYDASFNRYMSELTQYSIKKANYSHLNEIYRQYSAFLNKERVPMSYDKVKKYTYKELKDAYLKGAVYFIGTKEGSIVGWFTLRVVLVDNAKWELRLDNLVYKDAPQFAKNLGRATRCKILNLLVYRFLEQICKELGVKSMALRVSAPTVTISAIAEDLSMMAYCMGVVDSEGECDDTLTIYKDDINSFFYMNVINSVISEMKYTNIFNNRDYSSAFTPEEYADFVEEQSTKSFQTVLFEKFGKGLIKVWGYTDEIMAGGAV